MAGSMNPNKPLGRRRLSSVTAKTACRDVTGERSAKPDDKGQRQRQEWTARPGQAKRQKLRPLQIRTTA